MPSLAPYGHAGIFNDGSATRARWCTTRSRAAPSMTRCVPVCRSPDQNTDTSPHSLLLPASHSAPSVYLRCWHHGRPLYPRGSAATLMSGSSVSRPARDKRRLLLRLGMQHPQTQLWSILAQDRVPGSVRTRRRSVVAISSRRTEEMGAARGVGKGLVDENSFDEGREITQHLDGSVA